MTVLFPESFFILCYDSIALVEALIITQLLCTPDRD